MPRVSDLFHVRYGHSLELNALVQVPAPDGLNFVGRAARNNGVTARVLPPSGVKSGLQGEITVALGGQGGALASFVQPEPFLCGRDVAILTAKDPAMNRAEKIWLARCLWANHYRYGFGRQANRTIKDVELPETPSFVTNAVAKHAVDDLASSLPEVADEGASMWPSTGLVRLSDVVHISYGQSLELNALDESETGVNFVSRTSLNNGVSAKVLLPEGVKTSAAGAISVALGANPLVSFVQPEPFVCGFHVAVVEPKDHSMPFSDRLWLAMCIRANRYRYNYGRQANRTLSSLMIPARPPTWASRSNAVRGVSALRGEVLGAAEYFSGNASV